MAVVFLVFLAYRILTPPSQYIIIAEAPDSSRTARLRRTHYTSAPSYKIYYRDKNTRFWHVLFQLSAGTGATSPDGNNEQLTWSSDSKELTFTIGNSNIWTYTFN